jgi:hypothetical protein
MEKHEIDGYKAGSSGYRHLCRCDECRMSNRKYQQKHRGTDETPIETLPAVTEAAREPTVTVTKPARVFTITTVSESNTVSRTTKPKTAQPVAQKATPVRESEPVDASDETWTPGLWENIIRPIIYAPAQRHDGYVDTLTVESPYTYDECIRILEACEEEFDDLPLTWEYEPGNGIHIWRTDMEPAPEPAKPSLLISATRSSFTPMQIRVRSETPAAMPARPREVTRAVAPSVPGTPYRAPVNTARNTNTIEPFTL